MCKHFRAKKIGDEISNVPEKIYADKNGNQFLVKVLSTTSPTLILNRIHVETRRQHLNCDND
ncbi:MAG: hypothetical protein IJ685_14545, partial [Selenomonadaceae bacterium]|nr:hypothetical protein [Selenomonadaceae bacterium]